MLRQSTLYLTGRFCALRPEVDPKGLREFSVVYTDRSLNHMSETFCKTMQSVNTEMKTLYNAEQLVIVPGGGTYGMESVARQFGPGRNAMVLRNGLFSYRWTQIFDQAKGALCKNRTPAVFTAGRQGPGKNSPFAPYPIDEIVGIIQKEKPGLVMAPHVETSTGIILPNDYLAKLGEAVRSVDGLFVLDCIASGSVWVDLKQLSVDVAVMAPQKSWSSTPCAALILLGERGLRSLESQKDSTSDSFSLNLHKWWCVMRKYEEGAHMYHATMPTDGIRKFHDFLHELKAFGFERAEKAQWEIGRGVRSILKNEGFQSVAAEGFEAPGVVVSYAPNDDFATGKAFLKQGVQVAAGVPLFLNEGVEFKAFRIGLFGLDKLQSPSKVINDFEQIMKNIKA